MIFSKEDIYKHSGQYDKTVSVSFKRESEAYKKYGDYIVGEFYYTPKERYVLQRNTQAYTHIKNEGYVKFKASKSFELDEEKINELIITGFLASDVDGILQTAETEENVYSKLNTRELPDPLKIEINASDFDAEEFFLYLIDSRIKHNYKLTKFEIVKYNGIILRKFEGKIPKEDRYKFYDNESGEIKEEIKFEFLKSKFLKDTITDKEKLEFETLMQENVKEKLSILTKELQRCSEDWKKVGIDYTDSLAFLMYISAHFEPERLNEGKFPVWWDYERFLHIYMRHVSETKVGERFEDKSIFQYKFKDVKRLIEIILDQINDEIQNHFGHLPLKDFFRIGERSVYYNGDYYAIQIGIDGKLMRFHKKNTTPIKNEE